MINDKEFSNPEGIGCITTVSIEAPFPTMTQQTPPEPTNNHRSETDLPSFVKRGKLWVPEAAQRRSVIQKFWNWTGFKEKKLWDVLQLLIVPTALAIGAFYLQETTKQRDLQIADDRAKQDTLNRYFDQMSTLLFERKLRTADKSDEVRTVARARTLTAMRDLDDQRNKLLINFLREARLLGKNEPIISLEAADLTEAELSWANLSEVNLNKARLLRAELRLTNLSGADLSEATLDDTSLWFTDLSKANLSRATMLRTKSFAVDLSGANLSGAKMVEANLSGADLNGANLSGANLNGADLSSAELKGVNLDGAYLIEANLSGVKIDSNALQNSLLCRTTMPDGTRSDRDCD